MIAHIGLILLMTEVKAGITSRTGESQMVDGFLCFERLIPPFINPAIERLA
jgi:hypothetical protein